MADDRSQGTQMQGAKILWIPYGVISEDRMCGCTERELRMRKAADGSVPLWFMLILDTQYIGDQHLLEAKA